MADPELTSDYLIMLCVKYIIGVGTPSNHRVRSGSARLPQYLAILRSTGHQPTVLLQSQETLYCRRQQSTEPAFPGSEEPREDLRGSHQGIGVADPPAHGQGRLGPRSAINLVRRCGLRRIWGTGPVGGNHWTNPRRIGRHQNQPPQAAAQCVDEVLSVVSDGDVAALWARFLSR